MSIVERAAAGWTDMWPPLTVVTAARPVSCECYIFAIPTVNAAKVAEAVAEAVRTAHGGPGRFGEWAGSAGLSADGSALSVVELADALAAIS